MLDLFDKVEGLPREELESLQLKRLKNLVGRLENSSFYGSKLKEAKVSADRIQSLSNIRKLPFTTKDDLRLNYPFGMLNVPKRELVRLHVTSGTTGSSVAVLHTKNDIKNWAALMARSFYAVGVRKDDILQNMAGYGMFTGGLGIHYGSEELGCLTIPAGAGNTDRQIKFIRDFGVTVLHIIPSYALYLGGYLKENGINSKSLPWRIALVGAEPHSEETRQKIEAELGLKVYNSYGLTEMNGPGVAFECEKQAGMHVWEDAFLTEIINPETLEPVEVGEVGELVMTTLCREGMPIIRYRTRDLTRFIEGECPCGRTHRRIDRILGRADDMLIIKGVNIYPMQIERVLMAMPEAGQNYIIELFTEDNLDQMRVKVEIREEYFVEDMRKLNAIRQHITNKLRNEILITPRVELVQLNSIPRAEGKAKRVSDLRIK